jgi:hypothetical protein
MKYKAGDTVTIVSESIVDSKPLSRLGNPQFGFGPHLGDAFMLPMRQYCGKSVIIKTVELDRNVYKYKINGCDFYFTEDMFEGGKMPQEISRLNIGIEALRKLILRLLGLEVVAGKL